MKIHKHDGTLLNKYPKAVKKTKKKSVVAEALDTVTSITKNKGKKK